MVGPCGLLGMSEDGLGWPSIRAITLGDRGGNAPQAGRVSAVASGGRERWPFLRTAWLASIRRQRGRLRLTPPRRGRSPGRGRWEDPARGARRSKVWSLAFQPVGQAIVGPVSGAVGTPLTPFVSGAGIAVTTLAALSVPSVRNLGAGGPACISAPTAGPAPWAGPVFGNHTCAGAGLSAHSAPLR